jgi:hypothetical protein
MKYLLIFILWYTLFLFALGDHQPAIYVDNLEAAKHFEPTPESCLTAWDCFSLQNNINMLESACGIAIEEIKELETLKEGTLLELNKADLQYSVKNELKKLSEIESELRRLTKLAQDSEAILKNMNKNLFKHCLKKN